MSKQENATQTVTQIATYAYDGRRLRNHSLASAERMVMLGSAVAVKKNGKLEYIQLRSKDGATPVVPTAHMGQRYSYLGKVAKESTLRAWTHKDLLQRDQIEHEADQQDAEAFIAGVFRQVALSCIVEAPTSYPKFAAATAPKPSNVVNIADFRHRAKKPAASRPIEFDSERRAA